MQQSYSTEIAPCRCANPLNAPRRAHTRCFYEVKGHLVALFCVQLLGLILWPSQTLRSSSPRLLKRANQNTANLNVIDYTEAWEVQMRFCFFNRAVKSCSHWLKGILKLFEHNVKFKFTLAHYIQTQ